MHFSLFCHGKRQSTSSVLTTTSIEPQRPTSCILAAIDAGHMPNHIPEPLLEFLPTSTSTSIRDPDRLPSYRDVMAEERLCPLPPYEAVESTLVYQITRRQARGTHTIYGTLPESRQARRQSVEEAAICRLDRESITRMRAHEGAITARMLERQRRIKSTKAAEREMFGIDYEADIDEF